jgi:hypothetical protein
MKTNKNWFRTKDVRPFMDIALFSADFWGHSYWSHDQIDNELHYVLHFVDRDFLPENLCKVSPDEAADLRKIIEKFGCGQTNYLAVRNWAAERAV